MSLHVRHLSVEHHREPIGIGEARPRLSWQIETDTPDWEQTAYEIAVADGSSELSSGRISSTDSILVPWPAPDLGSRDRRSVRVRVWGPSGRSAGSQASDQPADAQPSEWSEPLEIELGLLETADWSAVVVGPDRDLGDRPDRPPVLVRRSFDLDGPIKQARLYVSAHGLYVAEINSHRIGQDVFTPGWTSYHHRFRYQTYDVTELLTAGANVLGATLAEGWYAGHLGFHGGTSRIWGDDVAFLAQIEVTYADGRRQTIATDADWQWADGPTTAAGIYAGETFDARLVGSPDRSWRPVRVLGRERVPLVSPAGPPIRRTEELAPVAISRSPSGRTIVDFGQNLVGRVRIRVRGDAGTTVTLRHAEVLEDGELATRPLRGAAAVDRYTCAGSGVEEWEPAFTYHGFRFVEVDGWPGMLSPDDIRAVVLHSDMAPTGTFESSNPLLNRFHENVRWTMRGNYMGMSTDCPQRDERLGWLGDATLFAPAAAFLYDTSGVLRDWLLDVALEHAALGTIPEWVPWFQITFPLVPTAVWGDGGVVMPWILYQRFGDLEILGEQYGSMTAWVDEIERLSGPSHLWQTGLQLGDWLDPAAPPDAPEHARTEPYFIATAYHAYTARIVARTAELLGRSRDAERYARLADEIKAAFVNEYVSPSGRVVCDAPTAYVVALMFELLPDQATVERARGRLLELLRAEAFHAATGMVGAWLICDALTAAGATDAAYHMLMQTEDPSWLYQVDGRDHGLGALGQPPARRPTQPGRHALVQPPGPGRGRGLDPWDRRRSGSGRVRLPPATRGTPARWWSHPCRGDPRHALRPGRGELDPSRRPARGGRSRAGERQSEGLASGDGGSGGGFRTPPILLRLPRCGR